MTKNFWNSLKEEIVKELKVDIEEIEEPVRYGDFAYPCFELAKKSNKNPKKIAKKLASKLKIKFLEAEAKGPYINFYVKWGDFGQEFLKNIGA